MTSERTATEGDVSDVVPGRDDRGAPEYRDVVVRVDVGDLRTVLVLAGTVLLGLLLSAVADRTSVGIALDAREVAGHVPSLVSLVLALVAESVVLVSAVVTPVVLAVRGRVRLLLTGALAIVAALAAFSLVHGAVLSRHAAPDVGNLYPDLGDVGPGLGSVAGLAAVLAALRPARSWARAWWSLVALLVVLDAILRPSGPLDAVLAVGVGGLVGLLVTVAVGRTRRELTAEGVRVALGAGGLQVTDVRAPAAGAHHGTFEARTPGGPVVVTVTDRRSWQRERVGLAYRRLRLRTGVDEEGSASPTRAVALEALLRLLASTHDAHVPAVRAVVRAPEGEALLACDLVDGRPLDAVDPAELTDDVLRAAWVEVARLREARVAHRELTLRHLLLAPDGTVWVTDLEHVEPGAPDAVLAGDVAELLAATSAVVGPGRAVTAAQAVLGPAPLAAAVGRLVPAALTAATRALLKKTGTTLETVAAETCRATGVARPAYEKIERFKPRTLVAAAMLVVAVYLLAPQLADLPSLVDAVRDVDPVWLIPVLLASAATYLGAALGLAGGTPGRVPVGQASAVALAASFVATFAPPGVGQVGLNVRYLQRRGFATPVAVSASAAKEAAVLCVHLTLLVTFALWAGSTDALTRELDSLPSGRTLAIVGAGLVVVVGVVLLLPAVRRLVRRTVVPAVRSSVTAMHDVVSSPAKMVALLGGVVLLPLGYAVCLYFSVRAFGGDTTFVAVALVSLTAGPSPPRRRCREASARWRRCSSRR